MARTLLTEIDNKEWYYDSETASLQWRVPDIREIVRAAEGNVILAADLAQVEIKIMGFLSGDPDLIAAINSGKDLHSYLSAEIFGERLHFDYELMNSARKDPKHARYQELSLLRSRTKTVVFGIPLTSYL